MFRRSNDFLRLLHLLVLMSGWHFERMHVRSRNALNGEAVIAVKRYTTADLLGEHYVITLLRQKQCLRNYTSKAHTVAASSENFTEIDYDTR